MNRAAKIAIAIIAVTGMMIFAVATGRIFGSRVPHVDLPRDEFPVMGVDLSSHNGDVDFGRVSRGGVDFVFLKASEGETFRDAKFAVNYDSARVAGLKVGAYHFFRFDCDGDLQGINFLASVGDRRLDLPLAIDVEEWGNPAGYTTDEVVRALRRMIFRLEGCGHSVIVYTNKQGYQRFVRGRFDELPVWVCSFTNPPIATDSWTLWQHSHRSHVDGIDGEVDLNTFNGDSISWERWLASDVKCH